jgi:hypothetical protein
MRKMPDLLESRRMLIDLPSTNIGIGTGFISGRESGAD